MKNLKLTSFEQLFFDLDSPECASEFFVNLEYTGSFSPSDAQHAIVEAAQAHVLSRCIIDSSGATPRWILSDKLPPVTQLGSPISTCTRIQPIDISQQPPLHLYYHSGPNQRVSLLFQIHHCGFDAMGFFQWLRVWQSAYGSKTTTELTATMSAETLQQLGCRSRLPLTTTQRFKLLPGQWRSIVKSWKVLKTRPSEIATPAHDPGTVSATELPMPLNFFSRQYTVAETAAINQAARSRNCTPTQLILATLFESLHDWHQGQVNGTDIQSMIRILVPVNERTSADSVPQACNYCTIVTLDRNGTLIANPPRLLHSLTHEFQLIRRWRLSLNFWRALSLGRLIPGGLAARLDRFQPEATAMLTNVGKSLRHLGPSNPRLPFDRVFVIPTLHQKMYVGLALTLTDSKLETTLHFNQAKLSSADTAGLFDAFSARLCSVRSFSSRQ